MLAEDQGGEQHGDRRERLDRTAERDQAIRGTERGTQGATLAHDRKVAAMLRLDDAATNQADECGCVGSLVDGDAERRLPH